MQITHEKSETRGIFYIKEGDDTLGKMTYHMAEKIIMVVTHTYVNPSQRGKGLAEKLVRAGAEYAKENGFKIRPACSYVSILFDRKPDLAELEG